MHDGSPSDLAALLREAWRTPRNGAKTTETVRMESRQAKRRPPAQSVDFAALIHPTNVHLVSESLPKGQEFRRSRLRKHLHRTRGALRVAPRVWGEWSFREQAWKPVPSADQAGFGTSRRPSPCRGDPRHSRDGRASRSPSPGKDRHNPCSHGRPSSRSRTCPSRTRRRDAG